MMFSTGRAENVLVIDHFPYFWNYNRNDYSWKYSESLKFVSRLMALWRKHYSDMDYTIFYCYRFSSFRKNDKKFKLDLWNWISIAYFSSPFSFSEAQSCYVMHIVEYLVKFFIIEFSLIIHIHFDFAFWQLVDHFNILW